MIQVDKYAKIVWDYMLMHQELKPVDVIFVFGSYDTRVAEYSAEVFLKNYSPLIVFSGGFGRHTTDHFQKTEADTFSEIAIKLGVPKEKVLLENKATNTGENVLFTRAILKERNINVKSIIVVQKPYMERRVYATFKKCWPEVEIITTSPRISYEDYTQNNDDKEKLISIMTGDLQRIKEYPKLGFQIEQEIPDNVWDAGQELIKLGYNKDLIK